MTKRCLSLILLKIRLGSVGKHGGASRLSIISRGFHPRKDSAWTQPNSLQMSGQQCRGVHLSRGQTPPRALGRHLATCPALVRSSQRGQHSVTSPLTEVTTGGGGRQRDALLWGGVLEGVVGHRGPGGAQGWNVASQTSWFTSTPWAARSPSVRLGHSPS